MKKKLWFRAKDYGWGWQPSSWEGWLIIIAYIVGTVFIALRIDSASHSASDALVSFMPQFIILTAVLIWIASIYGESPEWRWAGRRVPVRTVFFKSVILVAVCTVLIASIIAVFGAFGFTVLK